MLAQLLVAVQPLLGEQRFGKVVTPLCVLLAGLVTVAHVGAIGLTSQVDVQTRIDVDENGDAKVSQSITFDSVAVRALNLMGMDLHTLGGFLAQQIVAELSRRGVEVEQPRVDVRGDVITLEYAVSPLATRLEENRWEIKIEKTVQSMGETLPRFFSVVIDLEILVELPPEAVCVSLEVDGVRETCDNPEKIRRKLRIGGGERIAIESPGIYLVYDLPVETPVKPDKPPSAEKPVKEFTVGVVSVEKNLFVGREETILVPVTNSGDEPLELVLSLSGDKEGFSLPKTGLSLPPKTTANLVVEAHPSKPGVFICELVISSPGRSVRVPIRIEAVQPQPPPKIIQVFPLPSANNPEKLVVTVNNPGSVAEASLEVVISGAGHRTTATHKLALTTGVNQYYIPLNTEKLGEGEYTASTTLKTPGQETTAATTSFTVRKKFFWFRYFPLFLLFVLVAALILFLLATRLRR